MPDQKWVSDDGYAMFQKFIKSQSNVGDLNEATTRFQIIDTILRDILRWDIQNIVTERYVDKVGYADYKLGTSTKDTLLILEAKKTDLSFVLPKHDLPDRAVPFTQIHDLCKNASSAMRQAIGYAASLGSVYTAITNGNQWLIMLTQVPRVAIEDRQVIAFESLDAISKRFPSFWNCFAPLQVSNNSAYSSLLNSRRAPAPPKLSANISGYPVQRNIGLLRNQHATALQHIWDEVNNSDHTESFFKHCYVEPLGQNKNKGLATELLSQRIAVDKGVLEQQVATGKVGQALDSPYPEKPTLLIARIGRGKSTFIKFLKTVAAKDLLDSYIQIDVDFIDKPRSEDEVAKYIYDSIANQMLERYQTDLYENSFVRASLSIPIMQFLKTPRAVAYKDEPDKLKEAEIDFIEEWTKNRHDYLAKSMQHLKGGRKKSIVIFFDNLDKRDELQEEAFLVASAIARDWAPVSFICLRPGTFFTSRERGVLDSIAPRIIEVVAPPISVF